MKHYTVHFTAHVYDGIKTVVRNEMIELQADNKVDAKNEARIRIENKYRSLRNLGLSSLLVDSIIESNESAQAKPEAE